MCKSLSDALARALTLVNLGLLDTSCAGLPLREQLCLGLPSFHVNDEQVSWRTAEHVALEQERWIREGRCFGQGIALARQIRRVSETLFEPREGLPALRGGSACLHLVHVLDPDAMAMLYPDLRLSWSDSFDWCPMPPRADGAVEPLTSMGATLESHFHLGGALPPLFYWIGLVGGSLPWRVLRGLPSSWRRQAASDAWIENVADAAVLRMHLACHLQKWEPEAFVGLPSVGSSAWNPFEELACLELHSIRGALWRFRQEARVCREGSQTPAFEALADPLRDGLSCNGSGAHYAVGERRLVYALGRFLRDFERGENRAREQAELAVPARRYLATRNAFHWLLVHDRGADGLLRFSENFSRGSSLLWNSLPRARKAGRQMSESADTGDTSASRASTHLGRRRYGRMLVCLERGRMGAALKDQLMLPFTGGRELEAAPPQRGIEVRVSPPTGWSSTRILRAWLMGIRDYLTHCGSIPPHQIGLVFHFCKRGVNAIHEQILSREVRAARGLLSANEGIRRFVVGLDAAGKERVAPPRTFATAYRTLHNFSNTTRVLPGLPGIRLGWTYHVGEDVWDLLTGLRHVDEVARLLLRGRPGRIGHGLALGEVVEHFYLRRGRVEVPLGTHLLDLVWAYGRCLMDKEASRGHWLRQNICALCSGAGGGRLERCWEAMGLEGAPGARGGTLTSTTMSLAAPEHSEKPQGSVMTELELLTGLGFRGDPQELVSVAVTDAWLDMLKTAQQDLRRRLARQGICVEANPTSNLLIGGYSSYAELPYQALVDDDLMVSINTDDPGIFATNLPAEFAHMYDGQMARGMSHRSALAWLAERIVDAQRSTFLNGAVPRGEDAVKALNEILVKGAGRPSGSLSVAHHT